MMIKSKIYYRRFGHTVIPLDYLGVNKLSDDNEDYEKKKITDCMK